MELAKHHTLTLVMCCRPLRVVDCERWSVRDATTHRRIHSLLTIEQLMLTGNTKFDMQSLSSVPLSFAHL